MSDKDTSDNIDIKIFHENTKIASACFLEWYLVLTSHYESVVKNNA
jgi:hypothetical protein